MKEIQKLNEEIHLQKKEIKELNNKIYKFSCQNITKQNCSLGY